MNNRVQIPMHMIIMNHNKIQNNRKLYKVILKNMKMIILILIMSMKIMMNNNMKIILEQMMIE